MFRRVVVRSSSGPYTARRMAMTKGQLQRVTSHLTSQHPEADGTAILRKVGNDLPFDMV